MAASFAFNNMLTLLIFRNEEANFLSMNAMSIYFFFLRKAQMLILGLYATPPIYFKHFCFYFTAFSEVFSNT